MKRPFRSLFLGIATLLGSLAFAQPAPPYPVTITGQLLPCNPAVVNVSIATVQNTQPAIQLYVPLDTNCSYSTTLMLDDPQGWIQVGWPCSGNLQYATWFYEVDSLGAAVVVADLSCTPVICEAAFTVQQAMDGGTPVPWQITTTNLSTGNGSIGYAWSTADGTTSTEEEPTWTFDAPGVYALCLTIDVVDSSNNVCSDWMCDTVVIDNNGMVNTTPIWYDCEDVLWGPAVAGTPCTTFLGETGTWSSACVCVADSSITGCQAAFTIQQAMGGGALIPWQITTTNTSTGQSPLNYSWWLPDGSTSTEAEPSFTFTQPGAYGICLTVWNADSSCTAWHCDTIAVDTNGLVSNAPIWFDCLGMLWGSAVPGSPCDDGNPMTTGTTWTTACQCLDQDSVILDCLGIPGGTNLPGTACTTFLGEPGTWSASCVCLADSSASGCQAAFTVQQAMGGGALIPWQITTTNLSTGNGTMGYSWWMPDGSTSTEEAPTWTFNAPGVYGICLTIDVIDANNNVCTDVVCDTVVVDNNGMANATPIWYDCEGILWGPAVAGTPCDDSNPMTTGEVWTADCICTADSTNMGCEANFWAIQAYDSVPGGVEPIPNEVWVWNLSTGGNGNFQFLWNFGDGSSSTDAYPTHVYSGNGPWLLCLTVTSGNCTDTYCDSISVDDNGILNGLVIDGHPLSTTYTPRADGFTLNVIAQIPAGITEHESDPEIRLWPNPVDDALNLAFRSNSATSGTLAIVDQNGRTVLEMDQRFAAGANRLTVPVGNLVPGLYLVRINNGAASITGRFLKMR